MNVPRPRLLLLGTPAVERDAGAVQALPFERRSQLVVLLALRRDWVPRAEIAAMLWPEQDSKLAYANLRKTLFRMSSMPWAAAVESQGNALRLRLPTDVADFERALAEQRGADALAVYRGELLAGFDDGHGQAWTQWLSFERERLRTAWRGAALSWLASEDADAAQAIALSARLLDADALDEAALREHMRWLSRAGQNAAARAAYRAFADRLADELGLEPGAELRALHEAVAAPAVSRLSAESTVAKDDSFVGRGVELQRIADLLSRDECRLLSLIGPGGAGKTRLARRALLDVAPRFQHGALFVGLEDVSDPARFAARLADALELRGAGEPMQVVCTALTGEQRLLVLDNFELLTEHAAALLEPLLRAAPRLKLLVTSRVRLTVAGEWSMPIEGLPVPDPEDADRAEAFDAVRLFIAAARRVQPALVPAVERAAIVEICRQVEGLPLALELAAAWVRVLPCEAIARQLRSDLELLRARDPSHPARHASIEQVFDESWRHLTPVERKALSRLSLFHGGFTADAARAVAGAALPVLGALADKSLLRREESRMQLHPLVQQLARERLTVEGAAASAATEAAHAAHFHEALVRWHPRADKGEGRALDAIDADFENLRRAWQFSIAMQRADVLARGVPALASHCEHRARFEDGLSMLRGLSEAPVAQDNGSLRALALGYAALLEYRMARYDDAHATATQALTLARHARDREARFQALKVLGSCGTITGRLDDARRRFTQVLALARTLSRGVAQAFENLSLVEKRSGRYERSLELSLEALAQYRRDGNNAALAMGLTNLASMCMFMDDKEQAAQHLREALAISEREGLTSTRAFALANLTELALKTQDWDAARTHAEHSLALAEANGIGLLQGWLMVQLARLSMRRGQLGDARTRLAQASRQALTMRASGVKAAAVQAFAELVEQQGHARAARRVLGFAVDEPTFTMADRDELRVEWARRAAGAEADAPWPGIALDDLLRRIDHESIAAHAPLIAQLR